MIKTAEMEEILFQKLQDERCNFTKSDIDIKNDKDCYTVLIKDYEHIPFNITLEKDEFFGYIVNVYNVFEEKTIIFVDNKNEYDLKTALIRLGYYIGTRF